MFSYHNLELSGRDNMKKQLTQSEIARKNWEFAIIAGFCISVGGAMAPFALAAGGAYAYHRVTSQTQQQLEEKATAMWQQNGYDVTGFKAYEPGLPPNVTLKLTRKGDGQKFEGKASCAFSCKMAGITAATP
jgi:hypothetical protein